MRSQYVARLVPQSDKSLTVIALQMLHPGLLRMLPHVQDRSCCLEPTTAALQCHLVQ
jgi:hypothetical protein